MDFIIIFYKRNIKIEIFEAPLRREKYLHHFTKVIYSSNSISYIEQRKINRSLGNRRSILVSYADNLKPL